MNATVTVVMPLTAWNHYKAWACQQAGFPDPTDLPGNATAIATARLVADAQQIGGQWAIANAVVVTTAAVEAEKESLPGLATGTVDETEEMTP